MFMLESAANTNCYFQPRGPDGVSRPVTLASISGRGNRTLNLALKACAVFPGGSARTVRRMRARIIITVNRSKPCCPLVIFQAKYFENGSHAGGVWLASPASGGGGGRLDGGGG